MTSIAIPTPSHDVQGAITAAVPITSPYYDRIRALQDERSLTPVNSPHFRWLGEEITKMVERHRQRSETEKNIKI